MTSGGRPCFSLFGNVHFLPPWSMRTRKRLAYHLLNILYILPTFCLFFEQYGIFIVRETNARVSSVCRHVCSFNYSTIIFNNILSFYIYIYANLVLIWMLSILFFPPYNILNKFNVGYIESKFKDQLFRNETWTRRPVYGTHEVDQYIITTNDGNYSYPNIRIIFSRASQRRAQLLPRKSISRLFKQHSTVRRGISTCNL